MPQKLDGLGLALRVVCVIFLKTCPRTPWSYLQTPLNEYMRFLQSLDNLEDQEHLYHDNVLAERFRYRRSEISSNARNAKLLRLILNIDFVSAKVFVINKDDISQEFVLMILDLPDRILAVTSFTPIVIVDESIDSTTQKDRCSCNSKELHHVGVQ